MKYFIEPWAHQLTAIEFAKTNKDVALFWEMGTGKTATTINILRGRWRSHGSVLSTLILAPIVVLENWKDELKAHAQMEDRHIHILKGTGKKKAEQMQKLRQTGNSGVVITNYESMQNVDLVAELLKWKLNYLVCDESQRCKNHKSKRAKVIAKLSEGTKGNFLLSGTPILNSPMDIFMQFKILDQGQTFGDNFWVFQKRFFFDSNAGMPSHVHFPNWQPKPGAFEDFNKLISTKSLRATKKDCLDLPPMVRETRRIEMSPEQKRAYKEMRDDLITFVESEACVAQLAITKALRLQQIVSGFVKTDEGEIIRFKKTPREADLEGLLEDIAPVNKAIVWACFKENYKQIAEVCERLKIGYAQLHGGIKDRGEQLKAFRSDPECRVMIANPQSAGLGVNLIEAGYSIYYSKNFSLENDLQSEARNHRGGSEKLHSKITRIDLVAPDTLDEQVTEALKAKMNVAEVILDWDFK